MEPASSKMVTVNGPGVPDEAAPTNRVKPSFQPAQRRGLRKKTLSLNPEEREALENLVEEVILEGGIGNESGSSDDEENSVSSDQQTSQGDGNSPDARSKLKTTKKYYPGQLKVALKHMSELPPRFSRKLKKAERYLELNTAQKNLGIVLEEEDESRHGGTSTFKDEKRDKSDKMRLKETQVMEAKKVIRTLLNDMEQYVDEKTVSGPSEEPLQSSGQSADKQAADESVPSTPVQRAGSISCEDLERELLGSNAKSSSAASAAALSPSISSPAGRRHEASSHDAYIEQATSQTYSTIPNCPGTTVQDVSSFSGNVQDFLSPNSGEMYAVQSGIVYSPSQNATSFAMPCRDVRVNYSSAVICDVPNMSDGIMQYRVQGSPHSTATVMCVPDDGYVGRWVGNERGNLSPQVSAGCVGYPLVQYSSQNGFALPPGLPPPPPPASVFQTMPPSVHASLPALSSYIGGGMHGPPPINTYAFPCNMQLPPPNLPPPTLPPPHLFPPPPSSGSMFQPGLVNISTPNMFLPPPPMLSAQLGDPTLLYQTPTPAVAAVTPVRICYEQPYISSPQSFTDRPSMENLTSCYMENTRGFPSAGADVQLSHSLPQGNFSVPRNSVQLSTRPYQGPRSDGRDRNGMLNKFERTGSHGGNVPRFESPSRRGAELSRQGQRPNPQWIAAESDGRSHQHTGRQGSPGSHSSAAAAAASVTCTTSTVNKQLYGEPFPVQDQRGVLASSRTTASNSYIQYPGSTSSVHAESVYTTGYNMKPYVTESQTMMALNHVTSHDFSKSTDVTSCTTVGMVNCQTSDTAIRRNESSSHHATQLQDSLNVREVRGSNDAVKLSNGLHDGPAVSSCDILSHCETTHFSEERSDVNLCDSSATRNRVGVDIDVPKDSVRTLEAGSFRVSLSAEFVRQLDAMLCRADEQHYTDPQEVSLPMELAQGIYDCLKKPNHVANGAGKKDLDVPTSH